jgi:hypothetical protein
VQAALAPICHAAQHGESKPGLQLLLLLGGPQLGLLAGLPAQVGAPLLGLLAGLPAPLARGQQRLAAV